MKRLLVSIILVTSISCFGQAAPANTIDSTGNKSKKVSFVTKVDIRNATKDGIYMEGYVVNIPYFGHGAVYSVFLPCTPCSKTPRIKTSPELLMRRFTF